MGKEIPVLLLSGALLLMMYYMYRELTARSERQRERFLDNEQAVATAAQALLPLV